MKLSIAIVHYRTPDLLLSCLRSIDAFPPVISYEVMVVDNYSNDGTVDFIRNKYPKIALIENSDNRGFGRAANQAFAQSQAEFFLLLNPDISLGEGAIQHLLDGIQSNPSVGLCAPRLINPDGTLQYSCRRYHTLAAIVLRRTMLGRLFPNHKALRNYLMMDWDHSTAREVDWVLGAAFMLRREAIPNGRVMDERYFLYFEDVDLCLRLRKAGWKVMYYPEAVMVHHHQRESASTIWNRAKFEHLKSWIKFSWKHRHEPLLSRNRARD
jgi:GT2 family glycosyltransferase